VSRDRNSRWADLDTNQRGRREKGCTRRHLKFEKLKESSRSDSQTGKNIKEREVRIKRKREKKSETGTRHSI